MSRHVLSSNRDIVAFDPKHSSAQPGEQSLPACEDDNLHPLSRACHNVKHAFNSLVIREYERVVKDHRRWTSLVEQKFREAEAGQHRDLLLGTLAQSRELLLQAHGEIGRLFEPRPAAVNVDIRQER